MSNYHTVNSGGPMHHCVVDGHAGRAIYDIRTHHNCGVSVGEMAAERYVADFGIGDRKLFTIAVGAMPNEHGKTMYPPSHHRLGFDRAGNPRWLNDSGMVPLLRIPLEDIDHIVRALRSGPRPFLADDCEQAPIVDGVALVAMTTENCGIAQRWLSSHRVVGKMGEHFRAGMVEEPPAAEDDAPKYGRGR